MNAKETKSKSTYLSPEVIDYYANYGDLQKPEETIFNILKPKLAGMKMLDIGVGGGRTTVFFAPEVKSYEAFDYSEGMVERCKERFAKRFPAAVFGVGDATNLSKYQDASFDFILFSFNGIDYMPVDARKEFLKEVRRMLKPGGYFCFSTHNLAKLKHLTLASAFQFRLNIFAVIAKVLERMKVRRLNAAQFAALDKSDYVFINDATHGYGLEQCFIRTSFQLELLRQAGFNTIRGFSVETGKEFASDQELCASAESWNYYLCD
jgi:ubiquinone/menaquinone biosynthesis C-methylase UbiE